ncbi:MAG: hypothetical protein JWO30_4326 [Fibrobacteres bacterium]|nr:hypothetical protein [Fibrobacterota bacterium]
MKLLSRLGACLWPALFPLCALSRPLLPEPPLGTGSASFAGGGAAHASGVNAVFGNPAALSISDALQVETGMMGLSGGLSPYVLLGSKGAGKSSYSFGYFYDARPGNPPDPVPPRQGMIVGASWEALSWAVLGASVHSTGTGAGVGMDGFGIDEDAGALLHPWSALWLGLAAHNLQESGVGQEPEGFRTRRNYAASLGSGLADMHLIGITFHDPDAYYEFRSAGPPFAGGLSQAFSLASAFTPGGKLGFRGTFLLPPSGKPGLALGTFLNLPLGRSALGCAYTFQTGGSEETGEELASHSISINFRLGSKLDPIPPKVEVRADPVRAESVRPDIDSADTALAVPRDSSFPAQVDFRLTATDKTLVPGRSESEGGRNKGGAAHWAGRQASLDEGRTLSEGGIKEWTLIIRAVGADGVAGPEVKTFHGRDLPPRVIRWDAVDASGGRLPVGFYSFRLDAMDLAGNRGVTAWQLLEIGASAR